MFALPQTFSSQKQKQKALTILQNKLNSLQSQQCYPFGRTNYYTFRQLQKMPKFEQTKFQQKVAQQKYQEIMLNEFIKNQFSSKNKSNRNYPENWLNIWNDTSDYIEKQYFRRNDKNKNINNISIDIVNNDDKQNKQNMDNNKSYNHKRNSSLSSSSSIYQLNPLKISLFPQNIQRSSISYISQQKQQTKQNNLKTKLTKKILRKVQDHKIKVLQQKRIIQNKIKQQQQEKQKQILSKNHSMGFNLLNLSSNVKMTNGVANLMTNGMANQKSTRSDIFKNNKKNRDSEQTQQQRTQRIIDDKFVDSISQLTFQIHNKNKQIQQENSIKYKQKQLLLGQNKISKFAQIIRDGLITPRVKINIDLVKPKTKKLNLSDMLRI